MHMLSVAVRREQQFKWENYQHGSKTNNNISYQYEIRIVAVHRLFTFFALLYIGLPCVPKNDVKTQIVVTTTELSELIIPLILLTI